MPRVVRFKTSNWNGGDPGLGEGDGRYGLKGTGAFGMRMLCGSVTEQGGGGSFTINYYRKDPAFLSVEVPSPTPTC